MITSNLKLLLQRIAIFFVFLAISISAHSESSELTNPLQDADAMLKVRNLKQIDRRKNHALDDLYLVNILARGNNPKIVGDWGHAFILTQRYDLPKRKYVTTDFFGFYPSNENGFAESKYINKLYTTYPLPGVATASNLDLNADIGIRVLVNKEQYLQVRNLKGKYNASKYQAIRKDCVSLVSEAAKALNLKISYVSHKGLRYPVDRTLYPYNFVQELKKNNN